MVAEHQDTAAKLADQPKGSTTDERIPAVRDPITSSTNVQNSELIGARAPNPLSTGQTSTIDSSHNQTGSPNSSIYVTLLPFEMELAIRELRATLREAQEYQTETSQHQHLQLHVSALKEDAEILSTFVLTDEDKVREVAELLCDTRRTCRHLERRIIDLDIRDAKLTPSVTSGTGTAKSKTNALKLTPIQLPNFDGNASAFPVYRNVFVENILHNEELTDTGKWLRLKETLKGNAAELISEIPQSDQSLQIAWSLLVQVYGGDERPARAFHQISINEADRDAARFLWIKDPTQPPTEDNLEIFRFTRVAFGIVASPFILRAVIRYHAQQQKSNKFLDIILTEMYADNLVSALEEDIDPVEFYKYAKEFFGTMSMNLTKWATNNKELEAVIPQEDQLEGAIQPVLGLKWNKGTDMISLKQPKALPSTEPTPRTVARDMAARFDPLGWVAPIVLNAKIFFRKIWEKYKKWDELLDDGEQQEWNEIVQKLKSIDTVQIQRRYNTVAMPDEEEIHMFVDASKNAYAMVVYMVSKSQENTQSKLVISKTRLTPKKLVTIPKLELVAILLGCRLTEFVRKTLNKPDIATYVWSDSKCAIAWMEQSRMLPPILEKYVMEAKKCNVKAIRYVPSNLNYADVASRGTDESTLKQMRWWNGPHWLANKQDWPDENRVSNPESIEQLVFQTQVTNKKQIIKEEEIEGVATVNIMKFSDLSKLLRRTAYCLQAAVKFKNENFLGLQVNVDTNIALLRWIRWDQARIYVLEKEPAAGKIFPLRNISVFRDQDGVIRCQSRLNNTNIQITAINPILLVKKSSLTRLIIMDIHIRKLHAGTSHILAELRKKYWLPQGRREIQNTVYQNCFKCRRQTATAYPNAPPAPLPEFRVTVAQKPFEAIGLDICGPFHTRYSLGRHQPKQKRWVIILTCTVIRAVHLEVLLDMTTDEILLAFRRFQARRGTPRLVVSVNAPQFHKLNKCFKDIWHDIEKSTEISAYFAQHKIVWKFINEHAPWMGGGGLYERLIQSIKMAFEKTYGNIVMLDRQFETSIIEIEAIINSRPIAYVGAEFDSPIVTPAQFLQAQYPATPIDCTQRHEKDLTSRLWRASQVYLETFWRNWSEQYLLALRERHDHLRQKKSSKQEPEKGDIVVMIDPSNKRSAWRTAVVERKISGTDGKCRAVQIRLPYGVRLIRPIVKLAPLKLQMDLPKVSDDQLSKDGKNLTIALAEGALQYGIRDEIEAINQNADGNTNMVISDGNDTDNAEEVAGTKGKCGGGETVRAVPSNGLESEGGPQPANPSRVKRVVTRSSIPRGVSWIAHEVTCRSNRERPWRRDATSDDGHRPEREENFM